MIQQSNVQCRDHRASYSWISLPRTIISPPSHPIPSTLYNSIKSSRSLAKRKKIKTKNKIKHVSREVERCKAHASRATMVHHSCSSQSFRQRTAHHKYHPSCGQHSIFMFHRKNHGAIHSRILNHTNPASVHRPLRDLTDRSSTILRRDLNHFKRP